MRRINLRGKIYVGLYNLFTRDEPIVNAHEMVLHGLTKRHYMEGSYLLRGSVPPEKERNADECLALLIDAYRDGGEKALMQAITKHIPPSDLDEDVSFSEDTYRPSEPNQPFHLLPCDNAFALNPSYQKATWGNSRRFGEGLSLLPALVMNGQYNIVLKTEEISNLLACFVTSLVDYYGFDNALTAYREARAEGRVSTERFCDYGYTQEETRKCSLSVHLSFLEKTKRNRRRVETLRDWVTERWLYWVTERWLYN